MLFRPRIVALQLRTFSVPLCPGHTARFAFVSLLTRFAVIRALLSPPIGTHPHLSHLQERMFYFYHAFCSLKNEQPRTTNHAFLDMSFLAPFFSLYWKTYFIWYVALANVANHILVESLKAIAPARIMLDLQFIKYDWQLALINSAAVVLISMVSTTIPIILLKRIKPITIIKAKE